jgi:predicted permease
MSFLSDVRLAVRGLARSPIFAVTSIASVALGIAATAAIFSLSDALMFQPAAGVRNPSELVDIGRANDGSGFDNMSHPFFKYMRDHTQSLAGIAGVHFGGGPMSLGESGASERVFGTMVSGNYFEVLGTRAALGRFFRPDEDAVPGERPVVVLSHAFWTRRFNADPGILSRALRLNNMEFTVVGVAEPGFNGSSLVGADLWVPMAMVAQVRGLPDANLLTEPRAVWQVAVGRLKPGVSRTEAQAELNTLISAYKAQEPRANQRHTVALVNVSRIPGPVRLPFTAFLGFLFALTASLVAIACSNVAGMLLARAAARRREMATRLAVGASRGRLIGQLLTETMVLFVAAGAASIPLASWLVQALEGFLPALPVNINLDLSVNLRVVAFAMGVSLITAVVFGLAPARHAIGGDLAPLLHGANATADRRRLRLRNSLVAAQVALSLMLVATAFLFLRTLSAAAHIDPGFETANIQIASLEVSLSGYRDQQAVALAERVQERLRAVPGVTSVAVARMIPLQGGGFGMGGVHIPGRDDLNRDGGLDADWNIVSPEFFQTLDMRIVEGRPFAATDRPGTPFVAIVNQSLARRAWPGQSAVGQFFEQEMAEGLSRPVQVVGVAEDAKYRYITDEGRLFVFVPLAQQPTSVLEVFIRHQPDRPVAQDVRAAVAQVEPDVPVLLLQSFEDAAALGLLPQRLTAWIAGGVGTIGVLLAALGLYGLMAFLVTQRTREIAIRMALGASDGNMRAMVLRQAARLGMAGVVIGLALASGLGLLMRSLLVGVAPLDPLAFGGTAALFALVLAAACWIPARRAASTDPASALRSE